MIRWIPYAFVRIVLFFMMGIVFAIYFPDLISFEVGAVVLLALVVVYLLASLLLRQQLMPTTVRKIFFGFVGLMALTVAGYLNVLLKTEVKKTSHLIHVDE